MSSVDSHHHGALFLKKNPLCYSFVLYLNIKKQNFKRLILHVAVVLEESRIAAGFILVGFFFPTSNKINKYKKEERSISRGRLRRELLSQ